ncbi:hypothetical protein GUJ93_ZPchr0001g31707 [Zizania palustris]|uniref:DUF4408 domain-containing protein n=1 Tax=Zizania palustris TaxID=103762 RepID=A0A8J5VNJ0_ZIZPA|nr:hypothetical protein GUJ93_ZPchr0001g31707 [Zizania palustris]
MDPISIEKMRAMRKCSNCKRQQMMLPTLAICMVAAIVLCMLLTSPVWLPRLCSLMAFFFLTILPDLAMAFLLSPKCLFVVGNLIVAFLVGESRLAPRARGEPASLVNDIHDEHVKRNAATSAKATAVVVAVDHNALVGEVGQGEEEDDDEDEEGEEEELHKRVEDFIARVKKQRRMEDKSLFDTDR